MVRSAILLLYVIMISGCTVKAQDDNISKKVEDLIAQMTLEEKIGQMNQYSSFFDVTGPAPAAGYQKDRYEHVKNGLLGSMLNVRGAKEVRKMQELAVENSRLGIPLIFGFDVIHGFKTTFPVPIAEAASWDMEAVELSARTAATEASAAGLNWTFAPMVDICRDARWGRLMEGAGEDPYLGSLVAAARVRGFQGDDLTANNTIAACTKHFAAYGFAEAGKDYNTADVGTSTLYNVVLPPFKATVDAGVQTFMNSFNELNGIPATGDVFLQRDLLKGEWDFDGFVVSDWGSITEMLAHGFAEDGKHAAEIAANAGSDMDMESHLYLANLKTSVEEGKVSMDHIDDAVRRILTVKYRLGLFDDPYRYCDEEREKKVTMSKENLDAALDVAKKSIVLLKNENNMLPLPKSGKKIAVIGQLANDKTSPLGNWRLASDDNTATSVMEGMKKYNGNSISYEEGVKFYEGPGHFVHEMKILDDDSGIPSAVNLAKSSDVVILVLGENGYQTGEGRSRAHINLPGKQHKLMEEVLKVNKNVVLVLMNGRPLELVWANGNVSAIVEAWHLGTRSGDAIAQVLYGDYNPSGKLPMTFPKTGAQIPLYYNYKNSGRPGPTNVVFWNHYIDETNEPLYPFGYGLSYSKFDYSDLTLEVDNTSGTVDVSVKVMNSSSVDGEEVVQLYIRDKVATVTRPVKELKAFEKVMIKAGQTKTVSFTLDSGDLGFYNNQGKFVIEAGKFDLMVGTSSKTGLFKSFEIDSTFK